MCVKLMDASSSKGMAEVVNEGEKDWRGSMSLGVEVTSVGTAEAAATPIYALYCYRPEKSAVRVK